MTPALALILALTVLIAVAMIGDYGERWLNAARRLQDSRNAAPADDGELTAAHAQLMLRVVDAAVRGSLIAHDVDEDAATRTVGLVLDELRTNAAVFDGHEWRKVEDLAR